MLKLILCQIWWHCHALDIPLVLAKVDSLEGNTWTCGLKPPGHLAGFALKAKALIRFHFKKQICVPKCQTNLHQMTGPRNKTVPLPKCVLMDIYRAVPVKLLCSRYGMCFLVSGSMYSLARPKSMMWIMCSFLFPCRPMRKFSGLTSL